MAAAIAVLMIAAGCIPPPPPPPATTTTTTTTTTSTTSTTTSTTTTTTTSTTTSTTTTTVPEPPYPSGLTEHLMQVGGVTRRFLVHVPSTLVEPRGVVLVLHGGGGAGAGVSELGTHPLSVFRTVADREGFVVAYPEGLPANDAEGLPGWVDCRADNTVASGANDIAFLSALAEGLADDYDLPPSRVFMAGGSNGAQMTHAFAFHHSDLVGAVATGAGSLALTPLPGPCTQGPSQPVPIVLVHGTADTQMPYNGGCVANVGGSCNRGRVIGAIATRDRWLQINGLSGVVPTETVVNLTQFDAGDAHRFRYEGPVPVEWWRLDDAGHTVPSRAVLVPPSLLVGIQNRDIEFAEVAWDFFERQLPSG